MLICGDITPALWAPSDFIERGGGVRVQDVTLPGPSILATLFSYASLYTKLPKE
jgi:hypothetical protein